MTWGIYQSPILGAMYFCPTCSEAYGREDVSTTPLFESDAFELACQSEGLRCDECGRRA